MAQRNIEIVQTKIDIPTILVEHEGRMLPLHSKYNPIAEAERFIDSLAEEIEKSDHLLFYGVGLGYHVKVAQERYPEKVFSVYEPIEQVSNAFVKYASKTGVNLDDLAKNYLEPARENIVPNINDFSVYFAHRVLLVTLPIYEKLVSQEMQQFNEYYKKILKEKVGSKQIDKKYSERWVINMMMNVKHTFNTPNLLMQDNNQFEGKPVILTAAGPSLSGEIENLKRIKERGLAYIFAVGSANKALLKHDVMPDAVISYDPQGTNWHVFEEMMEQNIDTIPLIFGTTVGYETVDYYPGPKTHVVISKDTLTPYLHNAEMVTVNDSSTISNVTFQILQKLNVSKVILVGQNFAYRDNQFYASGIKRYDELTKQHTDGKLKDVEIEKSFYVEDVYGNEVRTNITFDTMRKEMEFYLNVHQDLNVINTTKDGAKIEGAPFIPLEKLLENELLNSVVDENWYTQLQLPSNELQQSRITLLEAENRKFVELFDSAQHAFKQLKEQAYMKDINKLDKTLSKGNKFVEKLHNNLIYKLLLKALSDIYTEQIYAVVSLSKKISDLTKKVEMFSEINSKYLNNIKYIYRNIISIYNVMVFDFIRKKEHIYYESTCGIFSYKGNWERKHLIAKDTEFLGQPVSIGMVAKGPASLEYKYKGSSMSIYGSNLSGKDIKIKINIDGTEKLISIAAMSNSVITESLSPKKIFEIEDFVSNIHYIKIDVLSEEAIFEFWAVEAPKDGLAYHINEVNKLEDLEVGKRIRCHYNASKNVLGVFEIEHLNYQEKFLSVVPKFNPNGVFYFKMVAKNKLIADRIIQNEIAFNEILKCESILNGKFGVSLPSGGIYENDEDNDWFKYIRSDKNAKLEWNLVEGYITRCRDILEDGKVPLRGCYYIAKGTLNCNDNHHWHASLPEYNTRTEGFRPMLIL